MYSSALKFLWCPKCHGDLEIENREIVLQRIKEGTLSCIQCDQQYPIRNFIPRFVEHESYAKSFGPQWNTFAKSQIDREGYSESQIRFDSEIGWNQQQLSGKSIIEIGSGAGRFVDIVSKRAPELVIGLDITDAVDAASQNVFRDNVLFVQGDVFESPIRSQSLDFAYSIGVLHHTPNPQQAFELMVDLVKPDGSVGVSLYEISLYHRPNRNTLGVVAMEALWALNTLRCEMFRLITTHLPDKLMIIYCKTVVPGLHLVNKVPVLRWIRYLVPSTCYRELPMICSMVDTMDTYSTKIVHQYRAKDVFQWFRKLGLREIIVMNSRAGWVSIVAEKGSSEERARRSLITRQPKPPGQSGVFDR
jgi:2-polyprenyl-3-methyl-5-hydroxy-6-metoxy-1,4-benzoquinol methylase